MPDRFVRRFESPDEVIELEGLRQELVNLAGLALARDIHPPGWRWSTHVRPYVGTEWCETRHVGLVLAGHMQLLTSEGESFEVEQGDVVDVPTGHDAWVVGDEPVVTVTWMGARTWLTPLHSLKERVLVTLLFTDIVDSTATARELGDRKWSDLLSSHDQLVADAVDGARGQVAKHTGDGMLAIFDGAGRALRCAVACRRAVAELGLRIRLAVHTGEVEVVGGSVHGVAIHEASRILDHAKPNEILVSDITTSLVAGSEFGLIDRGTFEFRGTGRQRRIFAVDGPF